MCHFGITDSLTDSDRSLLVVEDIDIEFGSFEPRPLLSALKSALTLIKVVDFVFNEPA